MAETLVTQDQINRLRDRIADARAARFVRNCPKGHYAIYAGELGDLLDEIEGLREELVLALEALKPFAAAADIVEAVNNRAPENASPDSIVHAWSNRSGEAKLTLGDFRRAKWRAEQLAKIVREEPSK